MHVYLSQFSMIFSCIKLSLSEKKHGEFCPGAVRVQEWLTEKYRARLLLEGDRDDGEKTEDLTSAFRREFRSSLLVASCKGLADMLLAAGMPSAVKRAHASSCACSGITTTATTQRQPASGLRTRQRASRADRGRGRAQHGQQQR